MSTIRVVNLQHTDATEPNIVLESDGTATFVSGITISGGTNLTVSGIAEFASGTVSAPTITFIDDNNTGIYEPATDTVAVTTAATERLRVDSSGRVGIGETSMDALLVIKGNSDAATTPSIRLKDGTDTREAWITNSAGDLSLNVGGDDNVAHGTFKIFDSGILDYAQSAGSRLRIDSSGRVLIGTTNAVAFGSRQVLAVTNGTTGGVLSLYNSTTATANTRISSNPTGSEINDIGIHAASTNGSIQFYTNNDTERMRISSSGNVGIGTTSPTTRLDVVGKAYGRQNDNSKGAMLSDDGCVEIWRDDSVPFIDFKTSLSEDFDCRIQQQSDGLAFTTGGSTSPAERMRIDSSGRLLVGVSSSFANANADNLQVGNNSAAAESGITLGSTTGSGIRFGDASDASAGIIEYFHTDNSLRLHTDAAEHVRINSTGTTTIWSTTAPMLWGRNETSGSVVGLSYYNTATSTTSLTGQVFRVMCDGDVENANNAYGAISDIKLKENVVDANSQWDDLRALQVRNYNFKTETGYSTHTQIGLVAQEAELVSPGLVGESIDEETGESTKTVNYSVLYMKAVKALQEAMDRIETLEANNLSLENRIAALENN